MIKAGRRQGRSGPVADVEGSTDVTLLEIPLEPDELLDFTRSPKWRQRRAVREATGTQARPGHNSSCYLLAGVTAHLAVGPTVLPGLPDTPTRRDDARRFGHVLATTYSAGSQARVVAGAGWQPVVARRD